VSEEEQDRDFVQRLIAGRDPLKVALVLFALLLPALLAPIVIATLLVIWLL
jgi:hypothetical protein